MIRDGLFAAIILLTAFLALKVGNLLHAVMIGMLGGLVIFVIYHKTGGSE